MNKNNLTPNNENENLDDEPFMSEEEYMRLSDEGVELLLDQIHGEETRYE